MKKTRWQPSPGTETHLVWRLLKHLIVVRGLWRTWIDADTFRLIFSLPRELHVSVGASVAVISPRFHHEHRFVVDYDPEERTITIHDSKKRIETTTVVIRDAYVADTNDYGREVAIGEWWIENWFLIHEDQTAFLAWLTRFSPLDAIALAAE